MQALGCRVTRGAGVQSEMELAFAGLHQLCAPVLDRLEHLPVPQREALRTAFGISAGPPPNRFLVGLAVLSLLSEVAELRPLVCLVDDQQWLDRASAQVLAFVGRRLGAQSVGLVFAARVVSGDLAGLPELAVGGLREADARTLLDRVLTGPIDAQVRDQVVAEARGNLLALLELPRGLTPAELAGGFGLPRAVPLAGSVEDNFLRRVGALPDQTRRLVLVAATDPSGDVALVYRAAARLEVSAEAAIPAIEEGLVEFGTRVRFRHPLVRSAAYRSASTAERRQVHRALAAATDARLDPDRRAWHRAQAAGPDDDVAAELERSAGRAQARGGLAAAAAFLQRAAALTLDPTQRAGRALAAAQAEIRVGGFGAAQDLLAMADAEPLSDLQRARADLVRAQLAYVTNRGSDAPLLLLKAAGRPARSHRRGPVPCHLPGRAVRGDLRRPPGRPRRGRADRGARRRQGTAAARPASIRSPARRHGSGLQRRVRGGSAYAAHGPGRLRHRHVRRGGAAPAVDGDHHGDATLGRRSLGDALRPARPARQGGRRAHRIAASPHLTRVRAAVRRRADRRRFADRRGASRHGGGRQQPRAVRRAGPSRLPR